MTTLHRKCHQIRNESLLFSNVIHLLLRWHFCTEPIHQGTIDLLAATMLHLSLELSCQITWRLWNFSPYIRTWKADKPVAMITPYLLAKKSLRSRHHEAQATLSLPLHLPIAIPFPLPFVQPPVFFNGTITLHILYRGPPERHGSLSPWPS